MPYSFYSVQEYKDKQSAITKNNWLKGIYDSCRKPLDTRKCKSKDCNNTFQVKHSYPKVFCSQSCSAHHNNTGRKHSALTKQRISKSISISPYHYIPAKKARINLICLKCKKDFSVIPYMAKRRKYCSNDCAIKAIGRLTTSPKASKGKPGIRLDVNPNINFYSTWEANMARVYNLVGLKWQYAPKIFDLGEHTYRPDFYLPDFDTYVEVKNYMSEYSFNRDRTFRKVFPNIKLDLILKDKYIEIKENYKRLVENWEY